VLQQAKTGKADLLVAATQKDSTNLFCAQVAKVHFRVPEVVARVYDPSLAVIFQGSGISTISPVMIAAESLFPQA
jgi:trk system potassium uptake protein TrkA